MPISQWKPDYTLRPTPRKQGAPPCPIILPLLSLREKALYLSTDLMSTEVLRPFQIIFHGIKHFPNTLSLSL